MTKRTFLHRIRPHTTGPASLLDPLHPPDMSFRRTRQTQIRKPVLPPTVQMKTIRRQHLTTDLATFLNNPPMRLPCLLILRNRLPRHQRNTRPAVPRLPPRLMKPAILQIIRRLEHPTIRTRPHLPMPMTLRSPLPPPMQILLLTLQALLIIPITGRRVPPKR